MIRASLSAVVLVAMLLPVPGVAAPVSRHVLDNGFTVLVRPDGSTGMVAVSLMVRAGTLFESPDTIGITNFLHRVMLRGAGARSARALAEAAEDIGGTLDASGDVEYAEVRGTALARHCERLLALVADVALAPALTTAETERERALIGSALHSRADLPFQHALDTLFEELYTGHPYAWPSAGLDATIARLTRDGLAAHHRATYRPDRMVLAVAGNVPPAEVVRAAERLFGPMPPPGAGEPPPPPAPAPTGGHLVVARPAQQAQVLVGYLAPSIRDERYAAARVLGAVLGGGAAARLFVELRERRGLAYSLGVMQGYRTGPGFLLAYVGTAPGNAEAALQAVLEQVERIRLVPVSEPELARAKAYLLGTLTLDRRTSARHAWHLAFFELLGVGWDFPDRLRGAIEAVTSGDVAQAARRVLARPTVVVLRPPAKAAP